MCLQPSPSVLDITSSSLHPPPPQATPCGAVPGGPVPTTTARASHSSSAPSNHQVSSSAHHPATTCTNSGSSIKLLMLARIPIMAFKSFKPNSDLKAFQAVISSEVWECFCVCRGKPASPYSQLPAKLRFCPCVCCIILTCSYYCNSNQASYLKWPEILFLLMCMTEK